MSTGVWLLGCGMLMAAAIAGCGSKSDSVAGERNSGGSAGEEGAGGTASGGSAGWGQGGGVGGSAGSSSAGTGGAGGVGGAAATGGVGGGGTGGGAPTGFQLLPGLANDIGVGANGAAWVIGTNAVPGGFGIHEWNGSSWVSVEGGAVRIAVDPAGNPWIVNDSNAIFRRVAGSWQTLPGLANDIGIGANGDAWVIGTSAVAGGYGIYQWNGSGWVIVDGGAVRIAVDPAGNPWVVNDSKSIFRRVAGSWQKLPGLANDIGVGANGDAWAVGTTAEPGGFGVYRWSGSDWTKVPGAAVQISVAPAGQAWIVNDSHQIFSWAG